MTKHLYIRFVKLLLAVVVTFSILYRITIKNESADIQSSVSQRDVASKDKNATNQEVFVFNLEIEKQNENISTLMEDQVKEIIINEGI